MWQPIRNCGKQLNAGYKIRQAITAQDEYITEYSVMEIYIDDYVLKLVAKTKNGEPVETDPAETLVLSCEQIIQ